MPAQDVVAGSSVTGYAISRDFYGNFIANVAATWSLIEQHRRRRRGDLVAAGDTKSATFTGHLVGTATVNADDGTFTATRGLLTVVPGAADRRSRVETVADGSGTVVPAQDVIAGSFGHGLRDQP